jgi:hypothetical protein
MISSTPTSPSSNLYATITDSLQLDRPLLHHLTADSTWLLSLPIPHPSPDSPRTRYNIIIDPWLAGPQVDYHPLFSLQTHATPSAIASIAVLEDLLREVEQHAQYLRSKSSQQRSRPEQPEQPISDVPAGLQDSNSSIDALVISHEFTDHCHRATLVQCSSSIPVFAATKAAAAIRSWQHFDSVTEIPELPIAAPKDHGTLHWKDVARVGGLPKWVGISRLVESRRQDIVGTRLHAAVMITFELETTDAAEMQEDRTEAVVYTPHGIPSTASVIGLLSLLGSRLSPRIHFLALLHGLHEVYVGGTQINLGGMNGAALAKTLGCKYWCRTHDEVKDGKGFIGYILTRKVIGWAEALGIVDGSNKQEDGVKQEEEKEGGQREEELADAVVLGAEPGKEVQYLKLGNGECAVLT